MRKKPIVGITMGDPAGSGPEITVKALADPAQYEYCNPIVIGDIKVMEQAARFVHHEEIRFNRCEKVSDAVFTLGTIDVLAAEKVFGVLGVPFEKTGGAQIKDGLQDDLYEMTVDHIGAGQANTTELCINHAMYDVQLADETLAKLCDEGFDYITVEPNTWNGQTEAIKTVGSQQCVLCSANLDEEVAYAITKAMCENTDVLAEASAALGYFDPSVAGTKALTGCDLHPGALRYYMEMGYINENGEAAK